MMYYVICCIGGRNLISICAVLQTSIYLCQLFLILQPKAKAFGIAEENMFEFWDVSIEMM